MNSSSLAIRHRSHLLLLGLILLLAGALRCFSLSGLGFWTDEFCSLSAAHGWGLVLDQIPADRIAPPHPNCTRLADALPITEIPQAMARDDAHPPLYFLMLRAWESVFGDSESGVRSLNVSFSLLAIALLFFTARDSIGSSAALTACLLMAVSTPQIQLSQEARNYMPVLVFSLLGFLSLEKIRTSTDWRWALLFGASLLAMMLTHYFAVGVAIAFVAYATLALRRRGRNLILISSLISGICFVLLWGRSLLSQRAVMQHGLGWLADTGPGHLRRRLLDLCRVPVRFFIETSNPAAQPWIAAIGGAMLLSVVVLFCTRRELRIWITWLVCAVLLVLVADLSRGTTQLNWIRYTLFATPPACVLLASALGRNRLRFVLPGVAIFFALTQLQNAYVPAWKTDFRTPIQIISHRLKPGDGLVIVGSDPIVNGIMYAAFQHYAPVMPTTVASLTAAPDPATLATLQRCPNICLIQLWPQRDATLPGFATTRNNQLIVPYLAEFSMGHFSISQHP